MHGIETHSPKTWIAYEQDEEPKGRARYWLRDEDMLPKVIPQARIWTYDYNSNCYSDNAQEVDILGLGETFLEVLWGAKDTDVGNRPLLFIGSCFGGIVVAQVGLLILLSSCFFLQVLSLLTAIILAGARESLSRSREICECPEVNHRCGLPGYTVAGNGNGKYSRMGCLNPFTHG